MMYMSFHIFSLKRPIHPAPLCGDVWNHKRQKLNLAFTAMVRGLPKAMSWALGVVPCR